MPDFENLALEPIPGEFLCPITQELFIEPVVAADGHTYERAAIQRWFNSNKTRSPVTNDELSQNTVYPNHSLHKLVDNHRRKFGSLLVELLSCENQLVCNPELVSRLLDHGADPDVRDSYGNTPLMIAVQKEQLEVVELLLNSEARVTCSNDVGQTAHAIARTKCGLENLVRRLAALEIEEGERLAQEKDERRQQQQRHRKLQQQQRRENLIGGSVRSVSQSTPSMTTFFPSLFGLQFQGVVDFSRPHNGDNPHVSMSHGDQQALLSRMLLVLGSVVVLSLLIVV